MHVQFMFLLLVLTLAGCSSSEQLTHNDQPLILATSDYSEYRIGEDWFKGQWSIAPHVEHDTLKVICYSAEESFEFRTDQDSIAFDIAPNTTKSFYVQMGQDTFAHTIIEGIPFVTNSISFESSENAELEFKYQSEKSEYLEELKTKFPLDFITEEMSDAEVVLAIMDWTHNRWVHDGNNSPSKSDAITILTEAAEGQNFPCFAYAIVLKDQLSALGYRARTVYLKTEDAATRQSSPGHVATEVYLKDVEKWVFIDPQFNVMPMLNEKPLNAVEFQDAITHHFDDFTLVSAADEFSSKNNYVRFVYDYLFYFDTIFDNRYGQGEDDWHFVNGKSYLMLVPEGSEDLSYIGFWDSNIEHCAYTNSLSDFYAKPN
ncbi:MAG: transglutaminase domain-containing protein [Bacteroidota bacterium]